MRGEGTVAEVLAGEARFAVVCGDAVEVFRALPDECAHVAYCDPSYGLSEQRTADVVECLRAWLDGRPYVHKRAGFMGHEWDAFVPGPEAWREVFRALKPGAYCVAFSSTRTVDLLGIAVRLAGFEMREGMCWVYASGFPKSLDVSKAIDAAEGAEREVVGDNPRAAQQTPKRDDSALGKFNGASPHITAPATPAAAQWSGYGTATKPAFEPLIVARKPLDGTVAANVQRHGCGALNIDAGRIAAGGPSPSVERRESAARSGWDNRGGSIMDDRTDPARYSAPHAGEQLGRFPASVAIVHSEGCERVGVRKVAGITDGRPGTKASGRLGAFAGLDRPVVQYADADGTETVDEWRCVPGCAAKVLGEQSGERVSGAKVGGSYGRDEGVHGGGQRRDGEACYADSGTAARFFYQCRWESPENTAPDDRNDVLSRPSDVMLCECSTAPTAAGNTEGDPARDSAPSSAPVSSSRGVAGNGRARRSRAPSAERPGAQCRAQTGSTAPASAPQSAPEPNAPSASDAGSRADSCATATAPSRALRCLKCGLPQSHGRRSIDSPTSPIPSRAPASAERPASTDTTPTTRSLNSSCGSALPATSDTITSALPADDASDPTPRFRFAPKASSADRLAFVSCTPGCTAHETVIGAREARARSTCPACGGARTKHEHATVKPLDLARYHARLLSLPAHVAPVALVPFCGTGVEARALMEVGFRVIAVDLDARHCAMTRRRLAQPLDAEATQPRRKAPAAPVVAAPVATSPVVAARPARRQPVATAQLSLFSPSPKDRA